MAHSHEMLREAISLQQAGRLEEAAGAYRRLREAHPEEPHVLFYAGSLELQRGNAADALPLLESFVRKQPDRVEGVNALSHVYRMLQRPADAAALWEGYAQRCPADARGQYELAVCRLAIDDDDGARSALAAFLEGAGDTAEAHLSAALAWHGAARLGPAKEHYERVLALDPSLQLARQNLAAVWQTEGDLDRAQSLYRAVLDAEPANADVHRNLGTLYKSRGDLRQALIYYRDATLLERGPTQLDPAELLRRNPEARRTSLHSLRLEAEQLEHLLALGRIESAYRAQLAAYREIIDELTGPAFTGHRRELSDTQFRRIGHTMHRLFHTGPAAAIDGGALNPQLDFADIERSYRRSKDTGEGGIVVIDGFLTGEALRALRAWCLETTFWFDYTKAGGYSGAYMEQGFGNELLLQLATELRDALPNLLGPHALGQMWAYIYDSAMSGITPHADQAALNLNFWLTSDTANLDPDSGGLVIYTREAPAEWDFAAYNSRPREIEAFAQDSPFVVVPHRCNRLVLFNSNLIHKTDSFRFRAGLQNRRINVTMLFGDRQGHS
ncbi:MAG: tetratricopeptide repeat protein [Gammaproteobacteria bacterium]